MNRGTIRDEIRRLVSDTDSTNPRWTDAVLNARIDEAHERVSSLTKCIRARATDTNIVAGTAEYSLPTDYLEELEILFLTSDSKWQIVEKKTERELDLQNFDWRSDTGDPAKNYYIRINKIGLYPIPSVTRASALRIDYIKRPTAFSADASIPFDSMSDMYPFHDVLCYDVASRCKQDERDLQTAQYYTQEFARRIMDMRNILASQIYGDTRMMNIYETARCSTRRTG